MKTRLLLVNSPESLEWGANAFKFIWIPRNENIDGVEF